MRILFVLSLAAMCGGCATITRGTTDQIQMASEPQGADVQTSEGHRCVTPCTIQVDRKAEFSVVFRKSGYRTQSIAVTTSVAGAGAAGFAGNLLIGGIVGMGVDASTGATLQHVPNPVIAHLRPEAATRPLSPAVSPKAAPPRVSQGPLTQ
jgi:hypothetical protein